MEKILQKIKSAIKALLFYLFIYFISYILSSIFIIHVAYFYFGILILDYFFNKARENNLFKKLKEKK